MPHGIMDAKEDYFLINVPESSDWECEMFGTGRGIVYCPKLGQEPNWFWRKMQYLAFGNRWVKAQHINTTQDNST